jgi:GT2 family glycosyltransferase/MoaA/NifB/PqqE/SkfB family radical SAM enzyme
MIVLSLLRQAETVRCIESIFVHTDIPFEIIIVDMGQSAEIVEWLGQLVHEKPNIRVVFNAENVGTTKGRNQGIRLAHGAYILFLDNDTEVMAGWLPPLLSMVQSIPEIVACGSKVVSPSGKVMTCAAFVKAEFHGEMLAAIGVECLTDYRATDPQVNQPREVPWYPATSLLVKKTALDAAGGFDEAFFVCEEDKDLSLRLCRGGGKIFYVPASVVIHHHNPAAGEYARIRNNTPVLLKDIKTFEQKWQCKVFIRHSRTYLHHKGMSDPEIDRIKKLSLFNKVVEEELQLTQLIVTVTNRCNHACGFCYYHAALNLANDDLTLDEYQKISASLGKLTILWITGGEPFLQKNLPDICRIFVANNQVEHIFIPTNGSLPKRIVDYTGQILEQNPGTRLTLMFSLEGLQELHDHIHRRPGAFQLVREAIKRVNFLRVKCFKKGRSFTILLNSVVSAQNMHQAIELMEYARANLLVDAHSLSPMRGQGYDPACQPPSGAEMMALYEQAKPYFAFYTKKSRLTEEHTRQYLAWMHRRYSIWADVLGGAGLPFDCQAGNLIGVLEPNGGIRVCELKPVVANVRNYDYNFPKAWFSAAADKNRLTVKGCSCTHACCISASDNLMAAQLG